MSSNYITDPLDGNNPPITNADLKIAFSKYGRDICRPAVFQVLGIPDDGRQISLQKTLATQEQRAQFMAIVELKPTAAVVIIPTSHSYDAKLIENGYEPIPVLGKAPVVSEWQAGPITIERIAAERAQFPDAKSTGLRTGHTVGADIDVIDKAHAQKFKELAWRILGGTTIDRVGAKGCVLVYRNETPIEKITVSIKGKKDKIEILGTGQQFVAFGIHPDTGRPYEWDGGQEFGETPLTVPLNSLPAVTPAQLREFANESAKLLTELGYAPAKVSGDTGEPKQPKKSSGDPVAEKVLRDACSYLDPSMGHDPWRDNIASIRAANIVGDDDLTIRRAIAQEWSRGDLDREKREIPANYKGSDTVDVVFDTMPPREGGRDVGSLFKEAKEAGWKGNPYDDGKTTVEMFGEFGKAEVLTPESPKSRLGVTCAADIVPENIKFLWPLRLAIGKHTAFSGIGGLGKSQLVYGMAATVSTGGWWPCSEGRAQQGSVVLLNAEDDQADMMVPRLIAAGADLRRVHIVNAAIDETGRKKKFNLLADLDKLYKTCREIGDVALIAFDPISSYLGGDLDSHRDTELRNALDPISQMASAASAAVASVTHFNKGNSAVSAMNRVMGGAAFVNAPRAAEAILQDPESEDHRLLLHLKTNLGAVPQGLRFHLELVDCGLDSKGAMIKATHVVWDGTTSITADAVVGMAGERDAPRLDEAIAFLQNELKDGPRPVAEIKKNAIGLSISAMTLRRAREQAGVIHRQIPGAPHGGWEYALVPVLDLPGEKSGG
jgi:hypothetical protein